ncbi:restriction endonuclease subunit S [Helicobacter pylori]|uniref:restriction endonuclease subunit S n=1 Tax=Helicobacter pylori TaxID=210 RepID=UPI00165A5979|nr:restriction endonuclease subunit S [Helicobacter pylori]
MHKIERLLHTLAPKGVEFRKLGDIGEFYSGLVGKSKKSFSQGNKLYVPYINVFNNPQLDLNALESVQIGDKEKQNTIQLGDVLFTGSSENLEDCAMSCVVTQKIEKDIYLNSFCFGFRFFDENLFNPSFLKHFLRDYNFRKNISKVANGVTRFNVSKQLFSKITIPIPPLEIQQEIVKILDAFTELNTELNARKKQYEYYQNMLLDFNDIPSNHKDANISQKTYPKRLKTLLQTLAPKGVEFRKLGEVLEYDQPNKYCVTSKEFDKSYPTPVLTAGKTFILGYTNEKDNIYQASKSSPVIIFDDFTTATQWVDFPFKVKSSAMKILLPKNPTINIRFIFFYMQTIPYNISGEHTRQWISRYSQITIPIPPLEIQQEIVKILDQFSALTTDLLAGIPAEIKARKKQYEYYREKLLTFKPLQNKA